MIIKMKKIHLILQDKDVEPALSELGRMGVLHVEHFRAPSSQDVEVVSTEIERLQEVISRLSQIPRHKLQIPADDWRQVFGDVCTAIKKQSELDEQISEYQSQINVWSDWGNFDPRDIHSLRRQGLSIKFYAVPEKALPNVSGDFSLETIFIKDGIARVIVISQTEVDLSFDEIDLPQYSLQQWKSLKQQAEDERRELDEQLYTATEYLDILKDALTRRQEDLAYLQTLNGRAMEGALTMLKGFCPIDQCQALEQLAEANHWAYQVEDPSDEDAVPTLIRNPRWVRLIKPVFQMINVQPGYREVDVSPVFLIFFSIFFGILIGDAGYGLIFAAGTAFAHFKMKSRITSPLPFYLMYLLSACTILWGAMTGVFFGKALFPAIDPLVPWLTDNVNVQKVAFFIGALHLSIAHIWRTLLKWPSIAMLGEMGWIVILWGMFYLAQSLVLGLDMPPWGTHLFIAGIAMVVLFSAPKKNFLKTIGSGLGALALNIVNSFTDVVSYIRLFAVSLAAVAVADAFNTMALDIGFGNVLTGFLTALILVLGHVFNMILGGMAILVHGLRLNVLEFSSHMDLEWAGIKYMPFKKTGNAKRGT